MARTYPQRVGDRLRRLIRGSTHSQSDMARLLGVSKGAVSSWISGRYVPRRERVMRMAAILGVHREDIDG